MRGVGSPLPTAGIGLRNQHLCAPVPIVDLRTGHLVSLETETGVGTGDQTANSDFQ